MLTGNLVSESLRLDDGDVIDDALVGVEIVGELSVVSLDDGLGCSLNSLGSDSSLHAAKHARQYTTIHMNMDKSGRGGRLSPPLTHKIAYHLCYIY